MGSVKHQPWHKRVLIPLWLIQLGFMLWLTVSASIGLQYSGPRATGQGVYILLLSFCCASLLLDVIEIILFIAHRLKPLFYLISQVIKTTLWLVLFIIALVALVRDTGRYGRNAVLSVGITTAIFGVILISFVGSLIYASIAYRRHRRGRADHMYVSPAYQDTSSPYERDTAIRATQRPAVPYVADPEIGHEHAHPAVFEMGGTSRSLPSHEVENGNQPIRVIPNGRK